VIGGTGRETESCNEQAGRQVRHCVYRTLRTLIGNPGGPGDGDRLGPVAPGVVRVAGQSRVLGRTRAGRRRNW
jgi:hypothetical protein